MDAEMEVFAHFTPSAPVFVLIAVGFIFVRCKKISLVPITELIVYLGTPSLVFTYVATKPNPAKRNRHPSKWVLSIFTALDF